MTKNNFDKEYLEIVEDILILKEFQTTKDIKHHGNGVYEHSVAVSYLSYKIAKKINVNYICAARAGLLHDFFYFDWRTEEAKTKRKSRRGIERFTKMHGFAHPFEAYENASKYFTLNKREKDVIIKHMFPLIPSFPKYIESWIVSIADKIVAAKEIYFETIGVVKSLIQKKNLIHGTRLEFFLNFRKLILHK